MIENKTEYLLAIVAAVVLTIIMLGAIILRALAQITTAEMTQLITGGPAIALALVSGLYALSRGLTKLGRYQEQPAEGSRPSVPGYTRASLLLWMTGLLLVGLLMLQGCGAAINWSSIATDIAKECPTLAKEDCETWAKDATGKETCLKYASYGCRRGALVLGVVAKIVDGTNASGGGSTGD